MGYSRLKEPRNLSGREGVLPESVSTVLKTALRQYGISSEIARYKFVLHWPEIVGAEIAKRSRPEYIRKNALVVRVCDSTWAQELSFQKKVLLSRLQKYLKHGEKIDNIFFVVGKVS